MADTPRYDSPLTGAQVDAALLDMAEHNSEAYAVGKRAGSDVPSSDPTYHNNAKYYAELAESVIPGEYTDAVRFDIDQTALKTDAEKAQARENIDSAPNSVVEPLINIWDEQWEIGTIDSSGNPISGYNNYIRTVNFIPCKPNTQYFVKTPTTANVRLFFYDSNKQFISPYVDSQNLVVTTPANAHFIKFRPESTYGTTYNNDISINYPSNYTGYYPAKVSKVDMPWADLLWTNASPTSAFAPQTISLDLSGYKFVAILLRKESSLQQMTCCICPIDENYMQNIHAGDERMRFAQVYVRSSGVQVVAKYAVSTYGTAAASNNSAIPIKIYGIR